MIELEVGTGSGVAKKYGKPKSSINRDTVHFGCCDRDRNLYLPRADRDIVRDSHVGNCGTSSSSRICGS